MRTLEEVRGRCVIDDITGCWRWDGGTFNGIARIHAPDWTNADGAMRPQAGRRAVWHICNPGKAIPKGYMVYSTCTGDLCLNPGHADIGSRKKHGEMTRTTDRWKNQPKRMIANRKTARKLSTITPEIAADILASNEGHRAYSQRTGISAEIVRRVRVGRPMAYQPIGGLFSGLLSLSTSQGAPA